MLKYPVVLTVDWFLTPDDAGLIRTWELHWGPQDRGAEERRMRVIESKLKAYHTAMENACSAGKFGVASMLNELQVLSELVAVKKQNDEDQGGLIRANDEKERNRVQREGFEDERINLRRVRRRIVPTAGASGGSRPASDDNKHESMPPAFMRPRSMAVDGDGEPADSEAIGDVDSAQDRADQAMEDAAAAEDESMDTNLAHNSTVEYQRDLLDEARDRDAETERIARARETERRLLADLKERERLAREQEELAGVRRRVDPAANWQSQQTFSTSSSDVKEPYIDDATEEIYRKARQEHEKLELARKKLDRGCSIEGPATSGSCCTRGPASQWFSGAATQAQYFQESVFSRRLMPWMFPYFMCT